MNHSASQHLAFWHHLSTFIDIHFLYLVKNISKKNLIFFHGTKKKQTQNCLGFNFSAYEQLARQTLKNKTTIWYSHSFQDPMDSLVSGIRLSRFPCCDSVQKVRVSWDSFFFFFIRYTPGALITKTSWFKQHNTCVTKDTLIGEGQNMLILFLWNSSRLNQEEQRTREEPEGIVMPIK